MNERVLLPGELRALCQLLWGDDGASWKHAAAVSLNVSKRNLDYWLAGTYDTPPGILPDLMAIAGRKLCEEGDRVRMWRQYQRRIGELQLLNQALEQGPQRGEPVADTVSAAE